MLTPRVFLTEECRNVKRLLGDTLRHAYGTAKSEEFYKECFARLETISDQLRIFNEAESSEVHSLASQLDALSQTVTRIERSHMGELSWPFALAFKRIAMAVCKDHLTSLNEEEPLFFFSAEGGLFVYRVWRERRRLCRRRIFNVVFPRSLKNQVLLHAILGHEIGHVAYVFPSLKAEFESKVTQVLLKGTPLGDPTDFKRWLKALHGTDNLGVTKLGDAFENWRQEYFCDLFGLLVMGPSFLPAHQSLFQLVADKSQVWSVSHPPPKSRYSALEHALDYLGWEKWEGSKHKKLKEPLAAIYTPVHERTKAVADDFKVVPAKNVGAAIDGLRTILAKMNGTLYEHPKPDLLADLLARLLSATPAVQTKFVAQGDEWLPVNEPIDFRHILFAGWMASADKTRDDDKLSLHKVNRLCDRAILHQEAIGTWSKYPPPPETTQSVGA